MPNPHFIAKYNDPIFHQIKTSFNNRSDDHPVLMLPVRLETRFMKYSRLIRPLEASTVDVNFFVQAIYKAAYSLRVSFDLPEDENAAEWKVFLSAKGMKDNKSRLDESKSEVDKLAERIEKVKSVTRLEKTILKDAVSDLNHEAGEIPDLDALKAKKDVLLTSIKGLEAAVNKLKAPSVKIPNLGKQYLDALSGLQKSIEKIFVVTSVNADTLDVELASIEKQIDEIEKLAESPDFKATKAQIKKIESQISHIKRQHKSGNVRLQDFRNGYTGDKDLKKEEFELRKKINTLKKKIDQEHVPVLDATNEIKKFPVQKLQAMVSKTLMYLTLANRRSTMPSATYIKAQKQVASQLKEMESKSKLPLDGSLEEIKKLKDSFAKLKSQVASFQKTSKKITTLDRTEKIAITRNNGVITNSLNGLKELDPSVIKVDAQILGVDAIRRSTISGLDTSRILLNGRDRIKKPNEDAKKQLELLKKELEEVQRKIKLSAANTTLLPRKQYNKVKSNYFSLRDHVNNVIAANPLPEANQTKEETDLILSQIENQILDQLVDVNDPRDRFYEEYRDRIVFTPRSEEVNELWVRIYPDDIAVDNHDERITPEEEAIAKDFYYEVYGKPAAEREDLKLAAWRAAATSLGVRRGAYILKAMEPKEVKTNTVVGIKNELDAFFDKTLGMGRNVRKKIRITEEIQKSLELFASVPKRLEELLKPTKFDPCLETKGSLEEGISILKSLLADLEKVTGKRLSPSEKEQVKKLALLLNESGKKLYSFYKANLEALNITFRPQLTFPVLEKKEKSWDKGATTEALPDRFVVVTKRGGQYQHIAVTKTIQQPLPVGLDPMASDEEAFKRLPNGDLQVPENIKWMFDFDAAVEAGMAVKIPLDKEDQAKGFDLVMAYGVQDEEAAKGQSKIDQLFGSHLYSDGGLEYLPVGTATNNTDQIKSPYRALDDDLDGAYEVFFGSEAPNYLNSFSDSDELKITDGQFFKEALGLPESVANFIRNHGKKDIVEGRAMNRALYNATIKYFFRVMVPNLMNNNDTLETMLFMLHHVSACGTIPAFRVDNQPYGVLPVSPVKQFMVSGDTSKGTEGRYLKNLTLFLKQTKAAFERLSPPVSVHSSAYEKDPQAEFLKVLGLEPFSKEFFYRFGVNAANRWQEPSDSDLGFSVNWDHTEGIFNPAMVANNYSLLLRDMGHTSANLQTNAVEKSNIYKNRFSEGNYVLGQLVQDPRLGEKLVETDKGTDYISWLRANANLQTLTNMTYSDVPKASVEGEDKTQYTVLFAMLRGSLVYDHSLHATKALDILKELEVKTLERLLSSHIDLVSYRLDAWLSGLSDFRLRELRQKKASGTYLGAYGFVHDLRPNPKELEEVNRPPAGLESPNGRKIHKQFENQGFIHGQSLNHAITAAVLRAGYNSIRAKGDNNNALSINLTSSRVRKALHLLEGVSNGQETGALLGYMFERALHEKYKAPGGEPLEMDVFIYRLRRVFPTYSDSSVDPTDLNQNEALKASNVVDGVAMIDHIQKELEKRSDYDPDKTFVDNMINTSTSPISFKGYPWGLSQKIPNPQNPGSGSTAELERLKLRAIIHEIDNMADALDALGDLITAEGVYQLVRGNHVRASAVLNAMSEGKVPIDPEIIRSMRRGAMVTHRAILQIPHAHLPHADWGAVEDSPRSIMEPSLNHWLAGKLGKPSKTSWKVYQGETEFGMTLLDLNMQPVDLVLLITTGGEESQSELQARCLDFIQGQSGDMEEDIEIRFNEAAASSDISFGEMLSLIQHLGKVIGAARPADARDFRIPEEEANFGPTAAGLDTAELMQRMQAAYTSYSDLYDSLAPFKTSKTSYTQSEKNLAVTSLKALSLWGFAGFYPSNQAEEAVSLAQRVLVAKAKMEENLAFAEAGLANLEFEADHGKWVSFLTEFSSKLFGSGFKILPKLRISNEAGLNAQLAMPWAESPLRHHKESYLEDWLSGISLVRNKLANLETVSFLTDILGRGASSFRPVQLPFDMDHLPAVEARDYWYGASFPESYEPEGDRLSLLLFEKENLASSCCALMLDEWMEIIPEKNQTTGIAFHFNQPDARAPQNLLLAVPPVKRGTWDFEELGLCVEEAFNLAKLRSVEPDQIDESMFAQLLPATATLAFGDSEFARRLAQNKDEEEEVDTLDQEENKLGYFIDYTNVNTGHESD
ncbi:hypothetical protein [Algoriphagus namhaensis]